MSKIIVAPCGIDCTICEVFERNVTDELRERISETFKIPKEVVSCKGCKDGNQCLFLDLRGEICKTLKCINKMKVQYCFECRDFPCSFLMPLADGASKFPQNIKLYNLCMMKKIGVTAWLEKSENIKHTYFTKKIMIGEGGSTKDKSGGDK